MLDFRKDVIHDEEGDRVPAEKMIRVELADGRSFNVRPSGTEPKIKYYMFAKQLPAVGSTFSAEQLTAAKTNAANGLKNLWSALEKDIDARLA